MNWTPTLNDRIEAHYTPLQSALRAAGVRGFEAHVEDTEASALVLSIAAVTGVEAFNLAALLRAGLDSSGVTLPRTRATYPVMTRHETKAAHQDLTGALAEAGIKELMLEQEEAHRRLPVLHIRLLTGSEAAKLAELLHTGLAEHYATASALRDALHARGVDGDEVVPVPAVSHLRLYLGEISLPTALDFGTALGAAPHLRRVDELADHADGEQLMARLHDAVKAATNCKGMDMDHHPCCDKCGHISSIALGSVAPPVARGLIDVLRRPLP